MTTPSFPANGLFGLRTSDFFRHSSFVIRHSAPLLLLFAVGLYVTAYVVEFLASPSGRFPMLDAAEHLELARQIAAGTLPAEPFFRAMLYPGLLSLFLRVGVSVDSLPIVASVLGVAFHLGSTLCVYMLARRAWFSGRAGIAAAILFGFNPVAIFFAAEPLDTTFGLFLFLAGLNFLHAQHCRHLNPNPNPNLNLLLPATTAAATALWSLAMLARPHYAIVLAGLPFLMIARWWRRPSLLISAVTTFLLVAGACLGAVGLWQKQCCGQFRVMPTQGAYSLWAGNRPGANGRYYEQQISLPAGALENGQNPARVESELLYRRETGDMGPLTPDRVNAHWKGKTRAAIRAEPLAWLGLMARKCYYLFNDFEQYNNQTFAIQKALSPGLRLNPLGWGITLVLCAAGLAWAVMLRRDCAGAWFAVAVAGLYGAGVILFFVSDRFRLPLLPFLCVGAGVWGLQLRGARTFLSAFSLSPSEGENVGERGPSSRSGFRDPADASVRAPLLRSNRARAITVLTVALLTGALTFSRAWGVHDLSPAVEDYVSLSIAAGKAGQDSEGLRWARRALELRPDHPSALARAVTSFYNLHLQGAAPEHEFPDETWACQADRVARIPQPAPGVRLVQAVALWKNGQPQAARGVLHSLLEPAALEKTTADDALGVLSLAGLAETADEVRAQDRVKNTASFYLLVALAGREKAARSWIPDARRESALRAEPFVRNIFP